MKSCPYLKVCESVVCVGSGVVALLSMLCMHANSSRKLESEAWSFVADNPLFVIEFMAHVTKGHLSSIEKHACLAGETF